MASATTSKLKTLPEQIENKDAYYAFHFGKGYSDLRQLAVEAGSLLKRLAPYLSHFASCNVNADPDSDTATCSCGLDDLLFPTTTTDTPK
jgi:hypothetical protein